MVKKKKSKPTYRGKMKKFYGHYRFYELLDEMAELHNKKNHDYAGKDPLSNLREFGWKGVVVRLGDKWRRIKNYTKQGELKVKEESLKDTLIDNAVYSLLCIILYEDEKEKKNRSKNFRRS